MNHENGNVNPPSQIFLKFNKQIELFMLIADSNNINFFEIGEGFTKLWTIQNDYFLWSMKHNN